MGERRLWTKKDDDFLRFYYPTRDSKWCAEQLGRSPRAVLARADKIGVKATIRAGDGIQWINEMLALPINQRDSVYRAELLRAKERYERGAGR